MFPFFNSQQGMQQNPMQTQPSMGMVNPQIQNPYNTNMNNGPSVVPGQNFGNFPNNLMNIPNNHLGVPQFGPFGSATRPIGHMGLVAQNMNMQQPSGNFGVPNGQFMVQNLLPMPMSRPGQVGAFGGNPGFNQLGLGMGNQNPGFFGNSQFGMGQANQQGMVMPGIGGNMMNPSGIGGQLPQGNWAPAPPNSGVVRPQQSQNFQPSNVLTPQSNNFNNHGNNNSIPNWKKIPGKNMNRNTNGEASHEGLKKPQVHQAKNAKRKFGTFNENNQKGFGKGKAGKFSLPNNTNHAPERKRFVMYTEQEIQKWREERKRNYPSKSNTEKKLTETEASLRREQLKEILAKQAELGVEVAEIPSHYLSNSDKRVDGAKNKFQQFNKKGKFQNKYDKRGRHNRRGRGPKKQNFENKDSSISSINKRKPSLLEKLLGADVKRDRSHLLQVFRFMVINSCFKEWPEKPLEYPTVTVREDGVEGDNADKIKLSVPAYTSEANINTIDQKTAEDGDNIDENDGSSSSDDDYEEEVQDHLKENGVTEIEKTKD